MNDFSFSWESHNESYFVLGITYSHLLGFGLPVVQKWNSLCWTKIGKTLNSLTGKIFLMQCWLAHNRDPISYWTELSSLITASYCLCLQTQASPNIWACSQNMCEYSCLKKDHFLHFFWLPEAHSIIHVPSKSHIWAPNFLRFSFLLFKRKILGYLGGIVR